MSNATAVSAIVHNLLLPMQQFYEIRSQLNECKQHLLNFVMQYGMSNKLAKKNNYLEPKHLSKHF